MIYCLNPDCQKPQHSAEKNYCPNCGVKLRLKERYRAMAPLGQGAMGRTFRAVDEHRLNDACVIKQFVLPPQQNQKITQLSNEEAVRLHELGKHPQIPDLYAHFEQDNHLYLVQELIDGQNLLQEVEKQGAFKEPQLRQVLIEMLQILQFIHDRGVIHRDIKPENIMHRHSDGKLVLIDFGVAKQLKGNVLMGRGTMVGTPGYAPTEQLQFGEIYRASDLYALGTTCLHLLTGMHPFYLHDAYEGEWIWRKCLPQGTKISDQLGQVLDKMLKHFVKERFQSADEVLQALNSPVRVSLSSVSTKHLHPPTQPAFPQKLTPAVKNQQHSSRRIDYRNLRDLLAAGKWKEADQETAELMLKVADQKIDAWLDTEHIEKFPCQDLRTLDLLWRKYSNQCFGFSVQKQIWESVNKDWNQFGNRVGWRVQGHWLAWDDLAFTPDAPLGHLPVAPVKRIGGSRALLIYGKLIERFWVSSLSSRLVNCNIG